jgi:diguanylate cyclase (GGDEF)-like protein
MIRFSAPVHDEQGQLQGVLVLNYHAERLLQHFDHVAGGIKGSVSLVNAAGYWLRSQDKSQEWGFMLKDRQSYRFSKSYPEIWSVLQETGKRLPATGDNLFAFKVVRPLTGNIHSSTGSQTAHAPSTTALSGSEYRWFLVSHIPKLVESSYAKKLALRLLKLGAVLFALAAVGAWYLAVSITRWHEYKNQLVAMAHYDNLTDLANRALFFDRLNHTVSNAKRYQRGFTLIYLDLDGFKEINDNHGHEVGDAVLVQVSKRLKKTCRDSDTIARLGGDEFAIILEELSDPASAGTFAKKILKLLAEPFRLPYCKVTLSVSLGISRFPQDSKDPEALVRLADRAMYLSKSKGKNTFSMSSIAD